MVFFLKCVRFIPSNITVIHSGVCVMLAYLTAARITRIRSLQRLQSVMDIVNNRSQSPKLSSSITIHIDPKQFLNHSHTGAITIFVHRVSWLRRPAVLHPRLFLLPRIQLRRKMLEVRVRCRGRVLVTTRER